MKHIQHDEGSNAIGGIKWILVKYFFQQFLAYFFFHP